MALAEKQQLFAQLIARLIVWIGEQGWAVTLADGGITLQRKVQLKSGARVTATDREHRAGSLHYRRLAQDLNLFVGGRYISEGGHPVYGLIGEHWEGMDPLCRWGGRFADDNHFSLEHEGRA